MAVATKSELLKLQKTLKTDDAIAKQFKVTRQAIHQLRRKYGIDSLLAHNPERNEKIVSMYKAGKTGAELAEKFDLSIAQTYRIIMLASAKKRDGKKKTGKKK